MKSSHKKIVEEALRLTVAARAALAGHLIESLEDTVDEGAELAWDKEIVRRLAEFDKGKVKTVPWSVARRQILGRPRRSSRR